MTLVDTSVWIDFFAARNTAQVVALVKERGELNPPERSARLALFLMADAGMELSGQIGGPSHFSEFGYQT